MSDAIAQPSTESSADSDKRSSYSLANVSKLLALGFLPLCLIMAMVEAVSETWRPLGIVVNVILLIVSVISLIKLLPKEQSDNPTRIIEFEFGAVMLSSLIFVVGFSQTFRHLSYMIAGFDADQTGYWHWLRFGLANFLDAMLFDWPTIYNWQISEIRATSAQTRFLVFLFRTLIEFIVVANIFQYAKILWRNRDKLWHGDQATADVGDLLIFAIEFVFFLLWAVPFTIMIGAIANDGLTIESSWSALKIVPPVALGIWLVVIGLRRMWSVAFMRMTAVVLLLGLALWLWIQYVPATIAGITQLQLLLQYPMQQLVPLAAIVASICLVIMAAVLLWKPAPWRGLVAIMSTGIGSWLIYMYWPVVVTFLKYLPQ